MFMNENEVPKRASIAVVGAGWWSQGWHLPLLHQLSDVKITAIVEPVAQPRSTLVNNMDSVDQLKIKYNTLVFESFESLLLSPIGETIDGVIIASPHATHATIVLQAIHAGLHILCEKPMTTDVGDAKMIFEALTKNMNYNILDTETNDKLSGSNNVTAAAVAPVVDSRKRKVFMVNHTANWRLKSRHIYDQIHQGKIGEINQVIGYFGVNLGWLFNDPVNVGWIERTGNMLGNGFCWGQLSHPLAWIYQTTGLKPIKVMAILQYSKITSADINCSVIIHCYGGAVISLSGSGDVPSLGDYKQIQMLILGSKGRVEYNGIVNGTEPLEKSIGRTVWHYNTSPSLVVNASTERNDDDNIPVEKNKENIIVEEGFEFENLEVGIDDEGNVVGGPESIYAFVDACLDRQYYNGANALIGLQTVVTIDAIYRSSISGMMETVIMDVNS